MRSILLVATAALALSACNQKAPGETAGNGIPSAPATMATTNAKIEPVPGLPAPAPSPSSSGKTVISPTYPVPADGVSSDCGLGKVARFVGKAAVPDLRAQVIEAVGHNRIRWIGPGDAVTMDYSEERLNADLDAGGKITGFRCG